MRLGQHGIEILQVVKGVGRDDVKIAGTERGGLRRPYACTFGRDGTRASIAGVRSMP